MVDDSHCRGVTESKDAEQSSLKSSNMEDSLTTDRQEDCRERNYRGTKGLCWPQA